MRIYTPKLILWVLIPLLLFSLDGLSATDHSYDFLTETETCTMTTTVTAIGIDCGKTTGSIEVKISGGKAPYLIEWDNSSNSVWAEITTNETSYIIPNLPKGYYLVKVMDGNGCVVKKNVHLKANSGDLSYTVKSNDPCTPNGYLEFNVTGNTGPYYVNLEGPTSGGYIAPHNNFTIDNLLPGAYKVLLDKDGCQNTKYVNIVASEPLALSIGGEDGNMCDDMGEIQVNISGGTSEYFIAWAGPTSGNTIATGSITIGSLAPGEYYISVIDANSCDATSTKTVVSMGSTMYNTLTQTPALCDNTGQIGVAISGGKGGYVVDYSGPVSGSVVANSNENTGDANITGLLPGTYTITVSDNRGCTSTESITVGGEITDLACILTATPVLCDNMGQVGVAITGGYPTYRVDYSGPKSGSTTATNTAERAGNATILDLPAGTYTIKVTDSRGCTEMEQITVGTTVTDMTTIVTQNPVICDNMGQIGVSINGGDPTYRVDYSGPKSGSVIATTTAARAGNASILGLPSGNYTIIVTDNRGCSDTKTISVGGTITDLSSIVTQTPVQCDNMGQIGVSITGGDPAYRVDYSGPRTGTLVATTTASKTGVASILDLPSGYYTIVVTDSRGCSDTKSITVGGEITDLACIVTQTPMICNTMGSISVAIYGGDPTYRVDYSGPQTGAVLAITTGDRSATANLPNLAPGLYTIKVTDSRGCSETETITVGSTDSDMNSHLTVNPQICESNSGIDVAINGGTPGYTIAYSGPVSGSVSSNGGSQFIQLPIGEYTITVTDANGCTASESATVGQGVNDLHCRLVQTHAICEKLGAIEVIIIGGKPGFTVKWETGHGTETGYSPGYSFKFDVPCPGVYQVTIIDANGCVVSESTEVRQLENNLVYELTPNSGVQEGNGYVQVSFQAGASPYSIDLTGPKNFKTGTYGPIVLSSLPSGLYSVVVTDANGCSKQQYTTIPKVEEEFVPDGMRINQGSEIVLSEQNDLENANGSVNTDLKETDWTFENQEVSDKFEVFQNYPNPFSSSTMLSFNLPKAMKATILVHDSMGKQINLIEKDFEKGINKFEFQKNNLGNGIYYYTIFAGKESRSVRMLIMN